MSNTSRRTFLAQLASATSLGLLYNACTPHKKAMTSASASGANNSMAGFLKFHLLNGASTRHYLQTK